MEVTLHVEQLEANLVRACIAQEAWAQRQIYEEHYSGMMQICQRYAGQEDDALDLLHEGFIKVFNYIQRYKPGTSLTAWIKTVMVNNCIDHYRKQVRRRTEDIDQIQHTPVVSEIALDHIAASDILSMVQQLSAAYRVVFNLYVLEGYSHKEIADLLHINESTSRSNLVKARQKLQSLILNHQHP